MLKVLPISCPYIEMPLNLFFIKALYIIAFAYLYAAKCPISDFKAARNIG